MPPETKCPTCGGNLHWVEADEPWHSGYWICDQCEGTFHLSKKIFYNKMRSSPTGNTGNLGDTESRK